MKRVLFVSAFALVATVGGASAASLPLEMLGAWCPDARGNHIVVYSRETGCELSERIVVRRDGFDLAEYECRFTKSEIEVRKPIDPSLRRKQFRYAYAFRARCGLGDADPPASERGMIGLRYEGELVLEWR